eukprot:gnl/Spiro4/2380_TR1146_c0_g1_i1.p1 gnl/Spiro4/2380_TR1146_c0_g1~~gnl/Spiro4/2380_TR1146_c0_g1_i1.p1  ORF type:complete len:210 (+),score=28.54 gnl/Spiro4/2380_TR1146_c0_g1_i1:43-630(+)
MSTVGILQSQLIDAVSEGNWNVACNCHNSLEAESRASRAGEVPYDLRHHLLCLLLAGQLENARFLVARQDRDTKRNISNYWKIGKALWKRDYQNIYAAFQASFPESYAQLIRRLEDQTREKSLQLLARAFSTIRAADASVYLGLPTDATSRFLSSKGWTSEGAFFSPPAVQPVVRASLDPGHLHNLTQFVVQLEH